MGPLRTLAHCHKCPKCKCKFVLKVSNMPLINNKRGTCLVGGQRGRAECFDTDSGDNGGALFLILLQLQQHFEPLGFHSYTLSCHCCQRGGGHWSCHHHQDHQWSSLEDPPIYDKTSHRNSLFWIFILVSMTIYLLNCHLCCYHFFCCCLIYSYLFDYLNLPCFVCKCSCMFDD